MDRLALTCENIARHVSRRRQAAILTEYLASLSSADRDRAVRFLTSEVRVPALTTSTLKEALLAATALDADLLAVCLREVGDAGETVSLLCRGTKPLSLAEAELLSARLCQPGKVHLLAEILTTYQPLALKYFVKAITGKLRMGELLKEGLPARTIDVVITALGQGEYTFAVRCADGFVNVGKAHPEFPEEQIRELARILHRNVQERFGRAMLVKPTVVLEVAFEGVEKNARRKGGFALQSPRILRWRQDKSAADCHDIEYLRDLYETP